MRKKLLYGVMLWLLMVMIHLPLAVKADGPTPTWTALATYTPTSTLFPTQATATSKYQNWMITPTPYTLQPGPTLNFPFYDYGGDIANTTINVYRTLNFHGVIDTVIFLVLVLVLASMLVRLVHHRNAND